MKSVYKFIQYPTSSNYLFDIKNQLVLFYDGENKCYRIQHFDDLPSIYINTKYPKYKNMELKWTLSTNFFYESFFGKDNLAIKAHPLYQFNYDDYIKRLHIDFNGCMFEYYKDDIYALSVTDKKDNIYFQIKVKKKFNETGYKTSSNLITSPFERIKGSDESKYPFKKIRFLASNADNNINGLMTFKGFYLIPINTMYKGI